MENESRKYDIVLLGPTGYTGRFVAEYIAQYFPPDVSWALAGRSHRKLHELAVDIQKFNADRKPPGIEILELLPERLQRLTRKAKVIINAIGPYSIHGSAVVEACAFSGTQYLDFSTETAWIRDVIQMYDATAKAHKAVIIPAIGNSSSPSDLTAFLLTKHFSQYYGRPPDNIQTSFNMRLNGMSGGSLASVVSVASRYGVWNLLFPNPGFLTPNPSSRHKQLFKRIFGYTFDAKLGHLTTSFAAAGNEAVVHRSKFLRPDFYSKNLSYQEYMPATGVFQAVIIHLVTIIGVLLLALPPFRSLVDRLRPKETGSGPKRELLQDEMIELNAIASGRTNYGSKELRAKYTFHGPMYGHSVLLAAEAAMVLLDRGVDTGLGGEQYGVLTPSCLGMAFVDRLRESGVALEISMGETMNRNGHPEEDVIRYKHSMVVMPRQ